MKEFPKIKGCELFLCGGSVRDSLLNKPAKDRDFVVVTKLTFEELEAEINKIGKVFVSKPEFLTIRCLIEHEAIDIAFPRSDQEYSDGRRPDNVEKVDSLEEDAARRDFTINSLFMGSNGKVLDFFDGKKDLEKKLIKTVGDPYKRFGEDYLRILRALRFSITMGFNIEKRTLEAMSMEVHNLKSISMDRIKDELNKALQVNAESTMNYIKLLHISKILKDKGLWFKLTNKKLGKLK